MAQWLVYPASDSQQGQVAVRPEAIASVSTTADNGARIGTVGGDVLIVRTPARDILKVLSDPPAPPSNVHATVADPTINTPTISGMAKPGSVVRAYEGDRDLGYAAADALGDWTLNTAPLAPGDHSIVVRQTDTLGNTSQDSPPVGLKIAEPPPPPEPVVVEATPEPAPEPAAAPEPPPPAAEPAPAQPEPTAEKPTKSSK